MIADAADSLNSADVIIMGASTRAAAFSALRAGFRPYCLDLFADEDTSAHVRVERVPDYPDGLISQLKALPRMPVIYTGGLENRPDILDAAAQIHELWGNSASAVVRSRDPAALAESARLSRMSVPEWRDEANPPPADGTWLLRPRGSAGGRGIVLWTEDQKNCPTLSVPHIFQKKISGLPFSAVFIASALVGDVRFVGMTRQLVGEAECHAAEFQWCGNIGPLTLPVATENLVRRFGNVLKWKLGLLGLFGVDMVITDDGVPYVTEVNPRYPASLELLEHATGQPLFADHCRCFTNAELPATSWNYAHPGEFMGKAVYYAPRELNLTQPIADPCSVSFQEFPEVTDLPAQGLVIPAGEPVCTVFAESFSSDQTWELLREKLRAMATRTSGELS
ncbi:ATP-grasp domain-containing protein [Planctomicrobium sp. SH661]|uniref:ATP-grasp domain-containing protein n=1 Tax=Planctomicrobium sp. SH661 TaxID=3448124 RepID=UPI003F5B5B94